MMFPSTEDEALRRRVVVVRSGGGLPGLDAHVGMWMAMEAAGIRATECHGTSAGAIVGACDAHGMSASECCGRLRELSDGDVRRERPLWKLRVPWLDSFLDPTPIRAVLGTLLPGAWGDQQKRLACYATRLRDGRAVDASVGHLSAGPVDACMASMAVSGVWPAVTLRDGEQYVDGGVRANVPVPMDWQSADEVWVLIATGHPDAYWQRTGILTRLLRNLSLLMQDQCEDAVARVGLPGARGAIGRTASLVCPTVRVLWPPLMTTRGMLRFDHALIAQVYEWTARQIETLGWASRPAPAGGAA